MKRKGKAKSKTKQQNPTQLKKKKKRKKNLVLKIIHDHGCQKTFINSHGNTHGVQTIKADAVLNPWN